MWQPNFFSHLHSARSISAGPGSYVVEQGYATKKVHESNVCQYVSLEKNPLEENVSELISEKNDQLHFFSTLGRIFTQPTEYWLG